MYWGIRGPSKAGCRIRHFWIMFVFCTTLHNMKKMKGIPDSELDLDSQEPNNKRLRETISKSHPYKCSIFCKWIPAVWRGTGNQSKFNLHNTTCTKPSRVFFKWKTKHQMAILLYLIPHSLMFICTNNINLSINNFFFSNFWIWIWIRIYRYKERLWLVTQQ